MKAQAAAAGRWDDHRPNASERSRPSAYSKAWDSCSSDAAISEKYCRLHPKGALVYSAISHRKRSDSFKVVQFEVHRNKVKLHRQKLHFDQKISPKKRKEIDSFSEKSRRRLREVAINAHPELRCMFVATYADCWPKDGPHLKRHLDAFLKRVKRKLPDVGYLWVLEFQRRGAPHFHLFLNTPRTDDLHEALAAAWVEIASDGSDDAKKMLAVHRHPKSFIDWDMGGGQYVCKYLDKERQKDVPDNFLNVGRFWGASRGLVPKPSFLIAQEMAAAFRNVAPQAVKQITRWLCKWHERHTGGRSRSRRTWSSYSIPTGAPVLKQLLQYFMQLPPPNPSESPF